MIQAQPMLMVDDVHAASTWFQNVLGLTSGHGGDEYEMLMDGDTLVAQLHDWEADEHANLGDRTNPSRGNGIVLWFSVDDFDALVRRVTDHDATVLEGPMDNPNSHMREVWLRGPDGYVIVVAGQ